MDKNKIIKLIIALLILGGIATGLYFLFRKSKSCGPNKPCPNGEICNSDGNCVMQQNCSPACTAPTPVCNINNKCVECGPNNPCSNGQQCSSDGSCVTQPNCSPACTAPTPVCNLNNKCVECGPNNPCSNGQQCNSDGSCVTQPNCSPACTAPTPVCNLNNKCVECGPNNPCSNGEICNSDGSCTTQESKYKWVAWDDTTTPNPPSWAVGMKNGVVPAAVIGKISGNTYIGTAFVDPDMRNKYGRLYTPFGLVNPDDISGIPLNVIQAQGCSQIPKVGSLTNNLTFNGVRVCYNSTTGFADPYGDSSCLPWPQSTGGSFQLMASC